MNGIEDGLGGAHSWLNEIIIATIIIASSVHLYRSIDVPSKLGLFIKSSFQLDPKASRGLLMLSNLTDEERCARISRILMKKDIVQSLLDTFNATTFGHALDEDDRVKLKTLEPWT
ncbi:hypothetical protein CEXT_63651 [Caerostris extrusa]|uniref:Uncharacterized protein n=1 Tax=Caerostris extrusa TaxID=172846 RepID=A0AAV4MDX2_CAEEX|nr:hypothetical protein CEXT_63651 [Caerostris extrusa]